MVSYLITTFVNFIIGAVMMAIVIYIVLVIRYLIRHKGHLSQAETNVKVKEVAEKGFTTCTNAVHAMDIVNVCPVKTRIQRVNENLYNVREVKD